MTKSMRDVWADTLIELGSTNVDLLVLDGDLGTSTRADRFAKAFPDRFYQLGIAEQSLVGTAVGLAFMGFVPWLSSFTVFFTHRALDQVRMSVAQTHANVKFGAAYAGLQTGHTGKTHLDVQDLAIMRAMPGMTVLAPADAIECAALIRWATEIEGPVFLRVSREAGPDVFEADYRYEPGRPVRLRDGGEVLLVSTGQQTGRTIEAADRLAARGVGAGVIHLPSLKPLDEDALVEAVASVPLVVTTEEHSVLGGLGGLVAEILSATTPRRLERVGIGDVWGESASNAWLLDRHGLTPERIEERVVALMEAR